MNPTLSMHFDNRRWRIVLVVLVGLLVLPLATAPSAGSSTTSASVAGSLGALEGFGATTAGGRGGQVIEVTNLNDSGAGSLRAALEASGPRIVVFRVGGTILLDSGLKIEDPFVTVAGQTAPGGGITLANGTSDRTPLQIRTHDVVVRYLSVRPGAGGQPDSIQIGDPDETVRDVVVDHVSASWAVDEVVSTWYDAHDVTISWSIVSEGLHCATHEKGCHSKGMLLGNETAGNISVHHNLMAHNVGRNPRISNPGVVDVVNNVIYDPTFTGGWGPSHVKGDITPLRVNYVGNYYKAGPDSGTADWYVSVDQDAEIYLEGNIVPVGPIRPSDAEWVVNNRHAAPPVTTSTAGDAFDQVLGLAGNSMGLNCDGSTFLRRDLVDERVIADVIAGTGSHIDDPSEVGGWPTIADGTPCADGDGDGMPDVWEGANGFDPDDPSDGPADADGDGITNIEEFLNGGLPGEVLCAGAVATLVGTAGADILEGTGGDDVIVGRGGDDTIRGRGGNDVLCGNGGNDVLKGGKGADELHGGSGDDVLRGSAHDDLLNGGGGADTLWGQGGADILQGRAGKDKLHGNSGDDDLRGGKGADVCWGGQGTDAGASCETSSGIP